MKNRGQKSGVRGHIPHPAPVLRSLGVAGSRKGFTLVEVLLASTISVAVFFAMGIILVRSFAPWKDGMAHWRLAQAARVTRTRILHGGFADGAGLLSSSKLKVKISRNENWQILKYYIPEDDPANFYKTQGWVSGTENGKQIKMYRKSDNQWAWAVQVGWKGASDTPEIKADLFTAARTGDTITVTYDLKYSTGGRSYVQPQSISAYLVNE